jgi:hypothetical protein
MSYLAAGWLAGPKIHACMDEVEKRLTGLIGSWDMPELMGRKDEIVKGDKLKVRLVL